MEFTPARGGIRGKQDRFSRGSESQTKEIGVRNNERNNLALRGCAPFGGKIGAAATHWIAGQFLPTKRSPDLVPITGQGVEPSPH
jgi:hypothetical protein